ncbi:MAG: CbbQ/NirQ/NorQ/GpvN family protein [Candidatus Brockarchaeota archaeon]|nr:CbbQ/NirQ/NorQ/GpvN family protein [Candidatus Brockarchaeota archaeon]
MEEYFVREEPYYREVGNEVGIFEAAHANGLPVMLKGPTGSGKTRFVQYMAWRLKLPLVTVACHEDLTSSDLIGRYLLEGGETRWSDGPLTRAVKAGGICYLDEIVEARKDTTVVIHPLTDHRRLLPVEKRGEVIEAPDRFILVISYNPGYQSILKNLKQSTRQRFVCLEFDYPPREVEAEIVAHESGVRKDLAEELVKLGEKVRNLKAKGLEEGASTRALIYAAKLIKSGITPRSACQAAISNPITDDVEMGRAIQSVVEAVFP